jgi:hypothetical protein
MDGDPARIPLNNLLSSNYRDLRVLEEFFNK